MLPSFLVFQNTPQFGYNVPKQDDGCKQHNDVIFLMQSFCICLWLDEISYLLQRSPECYIAEK